MSPRVTAHYDDYPINGETVANQYRSYLRRDLAMLLDYATARTLCKAGDWESGNGGALGFGDMSEVNGAIPGTSIGQAGHPAKTHEMGSDIDLGYYQVGQANNYLRPICPHVSAEGMDQYHCVSTPTILDTWRMAMFLGSVFESPRVRTVGVDGKVGPLMQSAIAQLCQDGWLSPNACSNVKLSFEETNMGYGWFQFHHHHAHLSVSQVAYGAPVQPPPMECRVPGCEGMPLKPHPYWSGRAMRTP